MPLRQPKRDVVSWQNATHMRSFSATVASMGKHNPHTHNDVTQLEALRKNIKRIEMRLDKARRRNEFERVQHLMRLLDDSKAKAQLIAERIARNSFPRN